MTAWWKVVNYNDISDGVLLPLKTVEDIAGSSLFNINGVVTNLLMPSHALKNKKGKKLRVGPFKPEVLVTIKDGTTA